MNNPILNSNSDSLQIIRERSIISCFTKGLHFFSEHYISLLRYLWPTMLFMTFLPIPGYMFFSGKIDAFIAQWSESNEMPSFFNPQQKSKVSFYMLRRVYSFLLILAAILILICVPFLFLKFDINIWYACLCDMILLLFFLPFSRSFMQLAFSTNTFTQTLGYYRKGVTNFSQHFTFEFVSLLFSLFVLIIGCLPFSILLLVYFKSNQAIEFGDEVSLPILFPLYIFISYIVASFVLQHVILTYIFCKSLCWGNFIAHENVLNKETENLS